MHKVVCKPLHVYMWEINFKLHVGDDVSANMQVVSSLSAGCGVGGVVGDGDFVSLAALDELAQCVPQLCQLKNLAIQQLQQ